MGAGGQSKLHYKKRWCIPIAGAGACVHNYIHSSLHPEKTALKFGKVWRMGNQLFSSYSNEMTCGSLHFGG